MSLGMNGGGYPEQVVLYRRLLAQAVATGHMSAQAARGASAQAPNMSRSLLELELRSVLRRATGGLEGSLEARRWPVPEGRFGVHEGLRIGLWRVLRPSRGANAGLIRVVAYQGGRPRRVLRPHAAREVLERIG